MKGKGRRVESRRVKRIKTGGRRRGEDKAR